MTKKTAKAAQLSMNLLFTGESITEEAQRSQGLLCDAVENPPTSSSATELCLNESWSR
jgi:hypothetical protein